MLQMLERFDLRSMGYGSPDALMAQIESKRLAFADRAAGYADPAYSKFPPKYFIAGDYNQKRGARIDLSQAMPGRTTLSQIELVGDGFRFVPYNPDADGETRELNRLESISAMREEFTQALSSIEEPAETATSEEKERYQTHKAWLEAQINSLDEEILGASDKRLESIFEPIEAADKKLQDGDTTYLTVTDSDGMMVSLIQSNYRGMGTGLVADGLGFMFQDRGQLFSLDPDHPNVFEPGKRPFHTIIPAFAYKKDMPGCQVRATAPELACPYEPWLSFGLMGGGMQPQGHVQIILNLIDFDMGLQEAGDAARWEHRGGCEPTDDLTGDDCEADIGTVHLESGIPIESRKELERRGHTVVCCNANGGGYQAIMRDFETGAWIAATEMRKDGSADGY